MSFGIPTEIPSIPGLSDVKTPTTEGFSNASVAAITDLATQSRDALFQNPMADVIQLSTSSVDTLQTKLTDIASGNVFNGTISSFEASEFLSGTGLMNLRGSLTAFSLHTDRLSGVLKGAGINVPGLEEIVTTGKMMNNMANLIDGSQGCLNIIGSVTGLFSQEQVSNVSASIASTISKLDQGVVSITEVVDTVLNAKNAFDAIVNKDTNFLGQCVEQVKSSAFGLALSTAMSDPCTKFIMEQVGTPDFLNKLQLPPTPSLGGR